MQKAFAGLNEDCTEEFNEGFLSLSNRIRSNRQVTRSFLTQSLPRYLIAILTLITLGTTFQVYPLR